MGPEKTGEKLVGGRFRIGTVVGAGSFGEVHVGIDIQTGERVAMKFETRDAKTSLLAYESKMYTLIGGSIGIGQLLWSGTEEGRYVMVMELLGKSLEDILQSCKGRFSLKTTLIIVDQMISRLEYLHGKNIIHRDLKPDNFMMGRGKQSHQLHLIDFGLSKNFRHPDTLVHVPWKEGKGLTGNARYAALNVHEGYEQARRDDLEAVSYVMVMMYRGAVAWQGLKIKDKEARYKKIAEIKRNTPLEDICEGCPEEFVTYLRYCRNLEFTERPDYNYCRKLFTDLAKKHAFKYDYKYDWVLKKSAAGSSRSTAEEKKPKRNGIDGDLDDLLSSTTACSPPCSPPVALEAQPRNRGGVFGAVLGGW